MNGRQVVIDISGIEEHMMRLKDKVRHLEEKIDVLCWLADEENVD